MKTFSDEALAALERGSAIVSASVEIIPSSAVSYSTVGIFDLDAVANAATSATGGLTAGVSIGSSFNATDIIRCSLPSGQTFTAYNFHNTTAGDWSNRFNVIPGGVAANMFPVGDNGVGYTAAADAFAAFGKRTFTGNTSYIFYIQDTLLSDNTGGLSILVERGIPLGSGDPIRLYGGYGNLDLPSDAGLSTFRGLGDRGLGNQTTASIGGTAQNLTLSLSGIEAAALDVLDASEIKNASVVVRRLIFDSAGKTLLGSYVFTRGRVDELKTSEVIGGAASIQLSIEGAARGLGRRGGRLRSDADQRLVRSTDGFYRVVSAAPEKTLYWGGKKPAVAGSSVGGGGIASGNVGGGGALLGLNSSR